MAPGHPPDDDDDRVDQGVDDALAALNRLFLGDVSLESVLDAVVLHAVRVLPGVTDASVTVVESGPASARTAASSSPLAQELDDVQYVAQDGPCLVASTTEAAQLVRDSAEDGRWPALARRARERGVGSVLSLPSRCPSPPTRRTTADGGPVPR